MKNKNITWSTVKVLSNFWIFGCISHGIEPFKALWPVNSHFHRPFPKPKNDWDTDGIAMMKTWSSSLMKLTS